jgi:hypothetical protein
VADVDVEGSAEVVRVLLLLCYYAPEARTKTSTANSRGGEKRREK